MLDKLVIALCGVLLALPNAALAHGGSTHLKGTLESASADQIVVKDERGAVHPIRLDSKTRYRTSSGGVAQPSELRAGDRVVVHVGVEAKQSTALEIRFGPGPGDRP
ncbi:MAG: hypothetical protein HYY35_07250 [Deltaproteobacteria bacterium]|nr:hypothetical protein [Deltaproteobacteria bacterium]